MMVFGLAWLLSAVTLVQLHYWGSPLWIKAALLLLISLVTIACQSFIFKRDWRFQTLMMILLSSVACWRVSGLPAMDLAEPAAGVWGGRWVGLPGQSSAMFQPYQYFSVPPSSSTDVSVCAGEPLPYRLWVRGLRPNERHRESVRPGLCVTLQLMEDPSGKVLPSGLESWRQRNRILASFRLVKNSHIEINHPAVDTFDQWRLDIRHLFEAAKSHEVAHRWSYLAKLPVLLGLVTGDRTLMRPAHWKVFSDTGTSHLMAISGSHVGMFAVFTYSLALWLVSRFTRLTTFLPAQHVALVLGWTGALGYALLAGFNVPTQRTLVMIGVAVVLKLRGHTILDWRAWWLALVAITVYDPLAIYDRGAWLSFFAVALILWVLQGRIRTPGPVKGWFIVQWAIFIGLTPLLLYAFGGFPWITGLANALAIPVTGFVVVPGAMLATLILGFEPPAGEYLLACILGVTDALLWFLQHMAELGGGGYRVPQPTSSTRYVVLTLSALLGVLWWLAPRGTPGKSIAVALMLPIMAGPGFLASRDADIYWMSGAQRPNLLIENEHSIWWVFEAGSPAQRRQPLFEAWLREKGYGYRWDVRHERTADWIKHGFVVQRYDKFKPLPGQVHLRKPVLHLPCLDTVAFSLGEKVTLTPSRSGENLCWLLLSRQHSKILIAGDLRRETQLAQSLAQEIGVVDTLLMRPRSGEKLLGAVLNRFQPSQVVEWPAASSLFPAAAPKLEARGIVIRKFSDFQQARLSI